MHKYMKREIIKIDRTKCNGCGICIPNCHEGALQIIDEKATLVSELMCDGLGACIGHCPEGAITIEEREAEAYNEIAVMKEIVNNGKNVVIAHLCHLKDHNENAYLKQGVTYLWDHQSELSFDVSEVIEKVHNLKPIDKKNMTHKHQHESGEACGCLGSAARLFNTTAANKSEMIDSKSQLTQWPVQMHLINPNSASFANSDLLLAADCVAFALGNFHQTYLKGKTLGIACPKLDSNKEVYVEKLIKMIDDAKVNTITVMIMEVPCCGGLQQIVQMAVKSANRKVPVKVITVSVEGKILGEEWI